MTERPIIFSGGMIRAILEDRKTQTRRVVKQTPIASGIGWNVWHDAKLDAQLNDEQFARLHCPYGQPGDRLTCYNCGHDNTTEWHRSSPHPGIAERRLHGGVRRSDLQPDKICGIRKERPDGLVSAKGACDGEGISVGDAVSREQKGDATRASFGVLGVPRGARVAIASGSASGRKPREQHAGQPPVGDATGELAGQEGARAFCGSEEVQRGRTAAYSMGDSERPMQQAWSGPCARCGSILDTGNLRRGDLLWVREAWAASYLGEPTSSIRYVPKDPKNFDGTIAYRADNPETPPRPWRPSIHMPRWASRINLEVTGVRVERLQEISEADAKAEGAPTKTGRTRDLAAMVYGGPRWIDFDSYREGFKDLWDSINGKKHPWESSPYVWVVSFRRLP